MTTFVWVFAVAISSVCLLSVTFVHPTQQVEIFGSVFMPFCTLAINCPPCRILGKSSQGTLPLGLNVRGVAKYSDVGYVKGYISEMVQDSTSGVINNS